MMPVNLDNRFTNLKRDQMSDVLSDSSPGVTAVCLKTWAHYQWAVCLVAWTSPSQSISPSVCVCQGVWERPVPLDHLRRAVTLSGPDRPAAASRSQSLSLSRPLLFAYLFIVGGLFSPFSHGQEIKQCALWLNVTRDWKWFASPDI